MDHQRDLHRCWQAIRRLGRPAGGGEELGPRRRAEPDDRPGPGGGQGLPGLDPCQPEVSTRIPLLYNISHCDAVQQGLLREPAQGGDQAAAQQGRDRLGQAGGDAEGRGPGPEGRAHRGLGARAGGRRRKGRIQRELPQDSVRDARQRGHRHGRARHGVVGPVTGAEPTQARRA